MSIIYEQTPGGLYPTGQRTVSTFPSGLIRVDRTFACKTSAADTHRATLAVGANFPGDSYPAMDGLKIFPEPQEKRRDDGFTEFTVSGFGRTNATGLSTFEWKTFSESGTRGTSGGGSASVTAIMRNKTKKIQKVFLSSEVGYIFFDESGATLPALIDGLAGDTGRTHYSLGVTDFQSSDYGHFVEVTYIIGAYKLAIIPND
jgi:hypothetical protein